MFFCHDTAFLRYYMLFFLNFFYFDLLTEPFCPEQFLILFQLALWHFDHGLFAHSLKCIVRNLSLIHISEPTRRS